MPKRSQTHSKQEQFRRICDQLFRDRKVLQSLTRAKTELDPSDYSDLIQWINTRAGVRRRLFPIGGKVHFTQLQRYRAAEPTTLGRELAWASAVLAPHVAQLREYVGHQSTFVEAYLKGDGETAFEALDELNEDVGPTLWGVSARIAALQQFRGLEAQKAYVRHLREGAPPQNLAAFLAYHISVRNETTVTMRSFRDEREDIIAASQSAGKSVLLVVRYYLLCEIPSESDELARLLSTGVNGTACDYYDLLIDTCRAIAATRPSLAKAASNALRKLGEVDDAKCHHVRFALATDGVDARPPVSDITARATDLFERFLRGDDAVAKAIESEYLAHPGAPEWLEPAVRAFKIDDKSPQKPQSAAVREQLYRVFARSGNSEGAADTLAKIAMNLRGTPWAVALSGYLELLSAPEPDRGASESTLFALAALEPSAVWFHQMAPASVLPKYQALRSAEPAGHSETLLIALHDSSVQKVHVAAAAGTRSELILSSVALRRGELGLAERLARKHVSDSDPLVNTRAVQLCAWAQLYAHNYATCLETVTSAILANPDVAHVCPIRELADTISGATRATLGNNVNLSVFYDIAAKILGTAYDVQRKDAFDDYLVTFEVERPSQLPNDFSRTKHAAAVYFLAQLCVAPILETSLGGYRTDEELDAERVEICSRLVRLDPSNAGRYEGEIKSIIREGIVGKRVREIDQNRVYVDIEGIRRLAIKQLVEPYKRYQEFLRHGIVVAPDQNAADDEAIMAAAYNAPMSEGGLFALPENEPASLLAALVGEIADLYFLNPAHGLERYLSTRIRHGVLEGHVRTPLDEEHIVSPRIKATNLYAPNGYWVTRLGISDPSVATELEGRLAKFSRAFDDSVQYLSSQRIRASRGATSTAALFQYAVKPSFVRLMAAAVTSSTPLEDFVGGVLTAMRNTLDDFLPNARRAIQHTKEDAAGLLVTLQKDVYRICERAHRDASIFEAALSRAGTGLQREFAHVEGWFYPGGSGSGDPFTLELAVDVAVRSVKALSRGFSCQVTATGESLEWTGRATLYLPRIVDLLFPALQNAAEYGSGGPSAATASVILRHEFSETRVRITNELPSNRDRAQLLEELARLRAEQESGEYLSLVATEGGTGLHKLRSHLDETVSDPGFMFAVEGNAFIVEFTLPSPVGLA